MSNNQSAYAAMKALRDEIEARLLNNEDYRALKALDKALGDTLLSEDRDNWVNFGSTANKIGFSPKVRYRTHPRPQLSQADAAFEVMEERGTPIPIADLVHLIREKGTTVGGNDPQINLSSTLSKDERFRSVRYAGRPAWWLSAKPYDGEMGIGTLVNVSPESFRDEDPDEFA